MAGSSSQKTVGSIRERLSMVPPQNLLSTGYSATVGWRESSSEDS
jgi:hypothetical protein